MSFVIQDGQLPASFTAAPMTDEEFAAFCAEHPDLQFEMTAEGEVIVMAPAYSLTAVRNARICRFLDSWSEQDGRGMACDSSGGFVLPDGSRRSPDASWTLKSRVCQVASGDGRGYWHLCPDFVIELRSETDRLKPLREKMVEYLRNGAQLGWLIDPQSRTVAIYRPGQEVEVRAGIDRVEGEGVMAGFVLDLRTVWNPLAD